MAAAIVGRNMSCIKEIKWMSDYLCSCIDLTATEDINLINTAGWTIEVISWFLSDRIPFFWQKAVFWNAVMRRGSDFTDNYKKDPNYWMPESPHPLGPFIYATKGGCHGTVLSCHENRQSEKNTKILLHTCTQKKKRIYNLENILENSVFVIKVKFSLYAPWLRSTLIVSLILKLGLDGSDWSVPGHFNAWERTTVSFEYMITNIHVQSYKIAIYKNSAINMSTKLYSKMYGYIKQMENYMDLRKGGNNFFNITLFTQRRNLSPF